MHITFSRGWHYNLDKPKGGRRRFNAGWSGEIEPEVAKMALDDGAAAETGKPATSDDDQAEPEKKPEPDKKSGSKPAAN